MPPLAALAALAVLAAPAPSPEEVAKAVATDMVAAKFAAVAARFSPDLAAKLAPATLESVWKDAVGPLGKFRELGAPSVEDPKAEKRVVWIDCAYEGAALTLKVVVGPEGKVVGLWLAPRSSPKDVEAAARQFLDELAKGEFPKAFARFVPVMAQALPEPKLREAWEQTVAEHGEFQKVLEARLEARPGANIVDLESAFAKKPAVVRVVLDARLQVMGLFFTRAWGSPDYVKRDAFEERDVKVVTGTIELPGKLCLPKGDGPFPAVVLVHGSGPHDADETLGPSKPFRDLGWGLAGKGIATLRYVKRTLHLRGQRMEIPTVKEESVDDAVAAAELLAKTPGIDPKRIFVVGHSLGARLAPRIAAASDKVKGFVLLAGATRPYGQLVLEQVRYLTSLDGKPTPEGEQRIKEAEKNAPLIDKAPLAATDSVDGIEASYWLDMRSYDAPAVARRLGRPMLVLQGERDYQVTMVDFAGWKKVLAGQKFVTFKSYPALNHLFVAGTGRSTPSEYRAGGHVAREVVDDLAAWVLRN